MPRKRGVARYCATRTRLDVSGRSANPLARGSAATKEKKGRKRTRSRNAPGMKKTALFDIVKRRRRERRIGQRFARAGRVGGNALGTRPEGALVRAFGGRPASDSGTRGRTSKRELLVGRPARRKSAAASLRASGGNIVVVA